MKINWYWFLFSLLIGVVLFFIPCRSLSIFPQVTTTLYDGVIRMYWGYGLGGVLFSVPFLNVFALSVVFLEIVLKFRNWKWYFVQGILFFLFAVHNYFFIGIWNGDTNPQFAFYVIICLGLAAGGFAFRQGWILRRQKSD